MKNRNLKLLSLVALLSLTGCGKNGPTGPEPREYAITLKDYQGGILSGVTVQLLTITEEVATSGKHTKTKEVVATAVTNEEGKATFTALPGEYHFKGGDGMPNGLAIQDEVVTGEEVEYELTAWPFLTKEGTPATGELKNKGCQFRDFSVTLTDGETEWNLAEKLYDYKCVLINVWASWCNPCMSEMGYIQQAWKRINDRVAILGLDCEESDTNSTINTIKVKKQLIFPTARDTVEVYKWVYASSIPTTFVIDKFGVMREYLVGSAPSAATFVDLVAPYLQDSYNPYKL